MTGEIPQVCVWVCTEVRVHLRGMGSPGLVVLGMGTEESTAGRPLVEGERTRSPGGKPKEGP